MVLTEAVRKAAALSEELRRHEEEAKAKGDALKRQITELRREIALDGAMLDREKIELARKVIFVRGKYASAGQDKASVIADAVHQIATGEKRGYRGLDGEDFGTKSYGQWDGQRSDHEPGYGPKRGSIIFQVGLTKAAREKGGIASLTDDEREAAIYLLTRLEAVQSVEASAAAWREDI